MAKTLLIEWKELGCKAHIQLLWDKAPKLCQAVVDCLPLRSISWHSVISGDNIGFALPVVCTTFENPQPRTRGNMYIYANGQLGIVPYGDFSEPGDVNTFGRIDEKDMADVTKAGQTVAEFFRNGPGRPIFADVSVVE
ncbi:MAG: hypothetical protein BGO82_05460 [Devosia sp. 67-54]|uniref:DUF3830 family protein n=1 Tax=unclassified Devosia TaxID=196773 RepID=UPI0009685547|nr:MULTISPECIES: DUF3830 family protein [unclassified Devosia]MBN9306936.1 DUF3830 family protein [Devosia sp.]OJX16969.1 MAG: hypothetical protein BGO82_05460 [Devosia sp. 67-54]